MIQVPGEDVNFVGIRTECHDHLQGEPAATAAARSSTAFAAIASQFPIAAATEAFAQTGTPEKKDLKVGFIPITCATPIIMAKPLGFYEKQGLNVEVIKTAGWAVIRDKTINKEYDAAHMLAPMPLASFRNFVARLAAAAKFPFSVHPHMLRHACGYKRTMVATRARCNIIWGTRTSCTPCATPNYRRSGSRIFGRIECLGGRRLAMPGPVSSCN